MSTISKEQVKHVAHLARLAMSEEEVTRFQGQLEKIITFAEQLNEVNADGVKPMTHAFESRNVLREDTPEKGLPVEDVLKNAPDHEAGQIRVPSVFS
ncbi:Asp-tRNA(Asn)/Glu-tRNA(Gln) amidotransferase subunit GatC [Bacillus sp. FSL W7-1360]